jgi:high-affinity iron transporter
MLPTFVIGLREGLEASLIVGIIAAFLVRQGRRDVLRWVFVGVGVGVLLCTGVGILLRVISQNLPQRQQEGLETVIGAVAVLMVTYMVVWMKRHSRDLKGQLEGATTSALAAGSGVALVAMAFLAVLREGFETVVFLLAAFNESTSGSLAGLGALLGILSAVALGYGIYRGGIRLNLSRFFRATGLVLVLVAGGLVVNALHTAHEAGWLNVGQQATLDLSAVVRPGSVQASLLTGMLGVQDHPVLIEVIGWLVYVIPVGIYVAWPPGKGLARVALARVALVTGGALAAAGVLLAVLAPSRPPSDPVTAADGVYARVIDRNGDQATIRASTGTAPARDFDAQRTSAETHTGIATDVYQATTSVTPIRGTISLAELARRNGGRLPLGVRADTEPAVIPISVQDTARSTFWVEPQTGRVIDVQSAQTSTTAARLSIGSVVLAGSPTTTRSWPASVVTGAVDQARTDVSVADRHGLVTGIAVDCGVVAVIALAAGLALLLAGRPDQRRVTAAPVSTAEPIRG